MRFVLALIAALAFTVPAAAQAQPAEWKDATTGHRILRISNDPGASLLYFTQRIFTPEGDKMVISTARGIATVDLSNWKVTPIVDGAGLRLLFTGPRTRTLYYIARTAGAESSAFEIWAANIDTGKRRTWKGH